MDLPRFWAPSLAEVSLVDEILQGELDQRLDNQSADSMANEVAGRKSGILEIYKSYNKTIDDKKLEELTKSNKSLSEIIKEMNL